MVQRSHRNGEDSGPGCCMVAAFGVSCSVGDNKVVPGAVMGAYGGSTV